MTFTPLELQIIAYGHCRRQNRTEDAEKAFREIQQALRGGPAQSGWIPVGERLPDDDLGVMIGLRDKSGDDVWIGWHDGDMGWVCDNGPLGERVTHWMPLPEAPHG